MKAVFELFLSASFFGSVMILLESLRRDGHREKGCG